MLFRSYLQDGNTAQAAAALSEAVALNPDYTDAVLLLAEVNLRAGENQAVIDSMSALLKKRPDLLQAQTLLAAGLRSLGKFDEAAAIFRAQTAASP